MGFTLLLVPCSPEQHTTRRRVLWRTADHSEWQCYRTTRIHKMRDCAHVYTPDHPEAVMHSLLGYSLLLSVYQLRLRGGVAQETIAPWLVQRATAPVLDGSGELLLWPEVEHPEFPTSYTDDALNAYNDAYEIYSRTNSVRVATHNRWRTANAHHDPLPAVCFAPHRVPPEVPYHWFTGPRVVQLVRSACEAFTEHPEEQRDFQDAMAFIRREHPRAVELFEGFLNALQSAPPATRYFVAFP